MEKKKMREETRQKHYLCFIEFFKILFALFQVVKSVKSDESYSKTALFNSLGLPVAQLLQSVGQLHPSGGFWSFVQHSSWKAGASIHEQAGRFESTLKSKRFHSCVFALQVPSLSCL
jgi:hypothetical protein